MRSAVQYVSSARSLSEDAGGGAVAVAAGVLAGGLGVAVAFGVAVALGFAVGLGFGLVLAVGAVGRALGVSVAARAGPVPKRVANRLRVNAMNHLDLKALASW
ncbi:MULTISPECIES: hypothetical protein [unclassified Streptomyces]|uniref:hypothetical protein n=1 Tax=unclassified Streptomyces TaxID=2593676 RepID=UPI001BECAB95|nr:MULTISPECIES: hypothetical protein [unclassified Streptomyces]MBT2404453.1 hypothetical protein [Streptomyces sp. ISL-21]MBT2457726.1 hypothetical protein [Streptomyces sp. ISL-86]MBT2612493.1 hypothetical protein [Streptomyces sp. ISL-87]